MTNIKLSIIIPSYADPLIHKTIDSLLENSQLGDQLEIIVVLDGRWTEIPIKDDKRVRIIHLGANRGMRGAYNAGMAIARGEFVGRLDEHVMFGPGYDKILTDDCLPNQIMTPRRYYLNPVEWKIIEEKGYVDCEKLVIQDLGNGVRKFAGQKWISRSKEMKDVPILESMAMQGSFWIMPKKWWDEVIGGSVQTEGYGPLIQDSHEIVFKTWKAGGSLVFNKKTWYAHKDSSFPRMHNGGSPENPANCNAGYKYALDLWNKYYEDEIKPKWKI